MAYDERLARRIHRCLDGKRGVTERKMFGGLAFLLDGRMCCGIVGADLVVRVSESEIAAVMQRPHVRPMDFTGKALSGFVYVSPEGCKTMPALRAWIHRGERFVKRQVGAANSSSRTPKARSQPRRRRK